MQVKEQHGLRHLVQMLRLGEILCQHPRASTGVLRYLLYPLIKTSETSLNQAIRYPLLYLGGGAFTPDIMEAMYGALHAMRTHTEEFLEPGKRRRPVVITDYTTPGEIVAAMDAAGFFVGTFAVTAYLSGLSFGTYTMLAPEEHGVSAEMCSIAKSTLGGILARQAPAPDAIITGNAPCDNLVASAQLLEYFCKVPTFHNVVPYGLTDENIKAYARGLLSMIAFLEQTLKRPLDWQRLRELAHETNETNRYLRDIAMLHREIPSPDLMAPLHIVAHARLLVPGSPLTTQTVKELYRIALQRLERERPRLAKNERIRVMFWDLAFSYVDLNTWMKREFGAITVADFMSNVVSPDIDMSSNEGIVRGLAANRMFTDMLRQSLGVADPVYEEIDNVIQEYTPHCVIMTAHVSCKQTIACRKMVEETIERHHIPYLFMDMDIWDARKNSEEEIKQKVREFFHKEGLA